VILRDEDSVEWECSELSEECRAKLLGDNNAAYMPYRVLQCRPAHHPEAAPRHISFPADVDLEDPTAQHWVLGRPLETRAIDPVSFSASGE